MLVLNLPQKEWRMPPRERAMAKAQFAILAWVDPFLDEFDAGEIVDVIPTY